MHRLRHKFHKTAAEYNLIEEGDRILIAVSGGKDSLALLELMAARVKVLKPRFSIVAVHVVMTNIPYQTNTEYLVEFARNLGVEMHIVETSFDATGDTRKSPCFLCSWNRRKALFETAKSFGCNKIALGHHQDDVLGIGEIQFFQIRPVLTHQLLGTGVQRKAYLIRKLQNVERLCPVRHVAFTSLIRSCAI